VFEPTIRRWLTPAGFAAAVPALAAYPLPAVSHALALLRTTAVPVLEAAQPDGGPAVYVVAPSHVLLVDAVAVEDDPHAGRHVRLAAPLGGSAVGVPVPVVDTDTLLGRLRDGVADSYLFPPEDAVGRQRSAHQAIGALAGAAAAARAVLAVDSNQDLTVILPALGFALEDLSAVADGLTPYCGDHADQAEARMATVTALLADCAAMARRAHDDVAARLDLDQQLTDLRLTDIMLRPQPDHPAPDRPAPDAQAWVWHASGQLTDTRPGGCHATIVTTEAHASMAAAIDAVRDVARRFGASRPDPAAAPTRLRLCTAAYPARPQWVEEMAAQAARLCLHLGPPEAATEPADDGVALAGRPEPAAG